MLEKTGAVVLTEDELIEAKAGRLPKRIEETWGLTLEELSTIIQSGNFQTTKPTTSPWTQRFDT